MPGFELKEGRYVTAMWLGMHKERDILSAIWTDNFADKEKVVWEGFVRTRSVVDDKIFGSDDKKAFWTIKHEPGTTEQEVRCKMTELMKSICEVTGLNYQFIDIQSDDVTNITVKIGMNPNMHMKSYKEMYGNGDVNAH